MEKWCLMAHRSWSPFSRLMLVPDAGIWSVAWDMIEVGRIAHKLGVRNMVGACGRLVRRQSVFFGSQFELLRTPVYFENSNRRATAYFHGKPGTGVAEFDECYQNLKRFHERIDRIQVTHAEMRDIILESGIAPGKVFLIPIGINMDFFKCQTPVSKTAARKKLGIPQDAVVVGSFQKDGVGWGEGMAPKLIKGPDVFVKVIEALKEKVPGLYVLLSGPARGYVKSELSRLGVPFVHRYLKDYPEIGELFQALDLYVVSSRQEGGPKAILESMASGVPLVTTRVGQAMEIVQHGENGWMTDVDDVEGLSHWSMLALAGGTARDGVLVAGRKTAEGHSYDSQVPLWRQFLRDFVQCPIKE